MYKSFQTLIVSSSNISANPKQDEWMGWRSAYHSMCNSACWSFLVSRSLPCWDVIQAHWMLWDLCVALLRMQTVLHRDLKASNVLECMLLLWMNSLLRFWIISVCCLLLIRCSSSSSSGVVIILSSKQASKQMLSLGWSIACFAGVDPKVGGMSELESYWRVSRCVHYMVWYGMALLHTLPSK